MPNLGIYVNNKMPKLETFFLTVDNLAYFRHFNHMDHLRTQIKDWMKRHKISRDFVAEKIGITKATLNKWLSVQPIPPLKQKLLEELMNNYPEEVDDGTFSVDLEFTEAEAAMLSERAAKMGLTPGAYCSRMLECVDVMKNFTARL